MENNHHQPVKPNGKLGILIPGLGAVATTFIAGVEAVKKGIAEPIGSVTQMSTIRLGKRTDNINPKIKDFVPLADLHDIVFGGWDIYEDNVYEAAIEAKVLEANLLNAVRPELEKIKPMKAVFDASYIKNITGPNVKSAKTKYDLALQVIEDIETFQKQNNCERIVIVWCGSTEKYIEEQEIHQTLEAFEKAMKENHPLISPSMIYVYAALRIGVPFANGAPNLACDIPALVELAKETNTPIAGKDFKTGQTLMKTIVAPGLHARALGIRGWFSTNILGNRDGKVLDDPENFKTKEVSKLSVLEDILNPEEKNIVWGTLSQSENQLLSSTW